MSLDEQRQKLLLDLSITRGDGFHACHLLAFLLSLALCFGHRRRRRGSPRMSEMEFAVLPLRSDAPLSKSKFVHGMQCPLYAWLEVRTDAPRAEVDAFTQALFDAGHEVGEHARRRWDARLARAGLPAGMRATENPREHAAAVEQTARALVDGESVIHEAAFTYQGVKVRVDVLERLSDGTFALNEVKSTSRYDEDKHLLDVAVQLWAVRGSGLDVSEVRLVHLNREYVWRGGDYDLEQLFVENDVTAQAEAIQKAVEIDAGRLLRIVQSDEPPAVPEGTSCSRPYGCPYDDGCPALGASVEHPVTELPGRTDAVARRALENGFESLLELDEAEARAILTYANGRPHEAWYCTWKATVTGERIILPECPKWLGGLTHPVRHLDFETIGAPLPVVLDTSPFEVVPLQYSIHSEIDDGVTEHCEFLADADDVDPRRSLIEKMLEDLGEEGSIIHWSAYEKTVIKGLIANPLYTEYRERLEDLLPRLRDMGAATNKWVFDKGFHGRWSLKKVYPVLVPGADSESIHEGDGVVSYDELDGVARGDEAAMVLLEYLRPGTSAERRQAIRDMLLEYCKLDTWATVEVLRVVRSECC